MIWNVFTLLIGFVLLIKSSEVMIDNAPKIATMLRVSPFIIGFSVVAFGTSAPELIIGIITGVSKTNQLTMGNVLGCVLTNGALVIGIAAIFKTISIDKAVIYREIPLSAGVLGLFMLLLFLGGMLSRIDGLILLVCFVGFLVYLLTRSKGSFTHDEEIAHGVDKEEAAGDQKQKHKILPFIYLVLSIAGVIIGGNFVVQGSTEIARFFGLSEFLIGVTIVSVGTSLPELVSTLIAMKKNRSDIAIGNIIGSNIFNILFVLGVSAAIHPIGMMKGIQWDFLLAFVPILLLFFLSLRKKELKRYGGVILFAYYILYILWKVLSI